MTAPLLIPKFLNANTGRTDVMAPSRARVRYIPKMNRPCFYDPNIKIKAENIWIKITIVFNYEN